MQEPSEVDVAAVAELSHQGLPSVTELCADVLEHQLLSLPVENDLTARWQEREALFHLMSEPPTGRPRQGPVSDVEAEFLALVSDKIQSRQDRLVGSEPQSASKLLEEDRCALGGP